MRTRAMREGEELANISGQLSEARWDELLTRSRRLRRQEPLYRARRRRRWRIRWAWFWSMVFALAVVYFVLCLALNDDRQARLFDLLGLACNLTALVIALDKLDRAKL